MFVVNVEKNIAKITCMEPMTSGSSRVYLVEFHFSPEWDDLARVAVFRSGNTTVDVLLDDDNLCVMPWEVVANPDVPVRIGAYGTKNGNVVLPTIWANTKNVLEGVTVAAEENPPSPDIYKQILDELSRLKEEVANAGKEYEFGHGLKKEDRTISVDMSTADNPDKTLPISAAAVESTVGNIEVLLKTI